jgi:hypothetical protein
MTFIQIIKMLSPKKNYIIKLLAMYLMGPYLPYPTFNYVMKTLRFGHPLMQYTPHSSIPLLYEETEEQTWKLRFPFNL